MERIKDSSSENGFALPVSRPALNTIFLNFREGIYMYVAYPETNMA